uniref:Glycoprotein-N-acetylgalactosamine 3-beta-galactosyltransferase 1 n=1 Tax=Cyprinus carpio TaxID=7962 RepID=A0A8C2IIW1_CYPCA
YQSKVWATNLNFYYYNYISYVLIDLKRFKNRIKIEKKMEFSYSFYELAQSLSSRVHVLCWIMTRPENHLKKLLHVCATWAKYCNQVLYMTSQSSDFLQHADWFLKADDDTFVVVENLRYLLSQHDTEKPVYFGAGYVLSREALRRFVQGFSTGCCENFSSLEDMALGRCMETMGVKNGKQVWGYSYYRPRRVSGPGCCADFVITFHYMRPVDMYMLEYFTHHLRLLRYKYRFYTNHEQNSTSELKHS